MEMHSKTTVQYHIILIRMAIIKKKKMTSIGKNIGKREPSYTVGWKVISCNHYGKQYDTSSEN